MRKQLIIIAVFFIIVVSITMGTLFAQKHSILDNSNPVDYTVKRPISNSMKSALAYKTVGLPVPKDQWEAYEKMINAARDRYETLNRTFGTYICVVTMRETVEGELQDARRAQMMFRADPFSVYLKYIAPDDVVGREMVYVEGQNNGRMIVTKGGFRPALAHITRAIELDSQLAKKESNHSLKEMGIASMMDQLLDVAYSAERFPDCKIVFIENAAIDNRPCTVIQITHEKKSDVFPFYKAQVFIDNQYQIPVRFVSYNWPDRTGEVTIQEEFTYTNIVPNVPLSDSDFDFRNPRYGFKKDLKIPE